MKLRQAANDVMLRINDVALRANGTEHMSHIGATILHPNTKVLDFQGLFVFLVVKTPFFTIAPFLTGSVTIAEVGFTSCRSLFYTEKEIFLLRL